MAKENKPVLEADHLCVSFGTQDVLKDVSLKLYEGEIMGLVGENGSGKTTLLRVLAGQSQPDTGFVRTRGALAYVTQEDEQGQGALSGGEKTRERLKSALDVPGSVLLCDEPTANLDMDAAYLLQKQLKLYQGAVLLVSHDRALLNAVCTGIFHLENGSLRRFPGTYEAFMEELDRERQEQVFRYEQFREEKNRLTQSMYEVRDSARSMRKTPKRMGLSEARLHKRQVGVARSKLEKSAKAIQSRIEHLESVDRPYEEPDLRLAMGEAKPFVSQTALRVHDLSYTYSNGQEPVLKQLDFTLKAGEKIAILGSNGSGKTTFLRALCVQPTLEGVIWADGVRLGLFNQEHENLRPRETMLEAVMRESTRPEWAARTLLASFGIRGDAVYKKCAALSGGEKTRVTLVQLAVGDKNVLLLDEPTNYLDIYAMRALEELLLAYKGSILLITHDRYLAKKVTTKQFLLKNGSLSLL